MTVDDATPGAIGSPEPVKAANDGRVDPRADIGNDEEARVRGPMSPVAERLGDIVGRAARASRVFGDPVERGGITVVPVARARWGFGGGAGQDPSGAASGSGGGGGATVRPVGFIEIAGGRARFRRIVDPASVAVVLAVALSMAALVLRRRGGGCRVRGGHTASPGTPE